MANTIQIDGINVYSNPVFVTDCSFPIVNWQKSCKMDDVRANLPIHIGFWNHNTVAPALTGVQYEIKKTPTPSGNACLNDLGVVTSKSDLCELIAPNMVLAGLKTPVLDLFQTRDEFCRRRNILSKQWCVFNPDGTLALGNKIAIEFDRYLMSTVYTALINEIYKYAIIGDSANSSVIFKPNEPDGLYTQLKAGWDQSAAYPCPNVWNVATEIDWADMTGKPVGTLASPDDVTVAGKTITVMGVTYQIPVGLNLAQFFDQLWIDRVVADTENVGGASMWELHIPQGQGNCLLKAASCMKPCDKDGCNAFLNDPGLRDRYARNYTQRIIELYPSGYRLPMFESNNLTNEMWFGPRDVGGRPTYGLFFDDMTRYFTGTLVNGVYAGKEGFGWNDEYDPLGLIPSNMLMSAQPGGLEDRAIYWEMHRTGHCIEGSMLARFAVLVCERHLWLHIKNCVCPTLIQVCADPVTVVP